MESGSKKVQVNIAGAILLGLLCCVFVLFSVLLLVLGTVELPEPKAQSDVAMMDRFDSIVETALMQAEEAAKSVKKRFWLDEDAQEGPVPDPEKFGSTDDPASMQWLLDEAQELLDGQNTVFSTDTVIRRGSEVTYYLDETILAITWKQVIDNCVYTISEVKISDPSQFRRHLEDEVFDGPKLSTPTKMSQKVNAVVGSSADHYRGRKAGIIVYDGQVMRMNNAKNVDTCYFDINGDMHFSYRGEVMDQESAQKFVDENQIRFSIAFGPVLVDNGERCEPAGYALGEVNDKYARAAICQMGPLHYLVMSANNEPGYWNHLTIHEFAKRVEEFGCIKAYAMDGGNTGSIVMNGKLINRTTFGYERAQGDLLYFCTAIPNSSGKE